MTCQSGACQINSNSFADPSKKKKKNALAARIAREQIDQVMSALALKELIAGPRPRIRNP